jgi:3-carboxy-cis,cis-muconate cycloisomerase
MYDPLFSTPAMTVVLSERNFVRHMHHFEVALAQALEDNSLAPRGTAADIKAVDPDTLDLATLAHEARSASNLCIPFVKMFTAAVHSIHPTSAGYVHWGATSQDVIDTATMLQLKQAIPLLQDDLKATCAHLASIIEAHKDTIMPGRTWLQQGPPITLGLKVATWLDALQRHQQRLAEVASRNIVLQFGGAVGTLAALAEHGIAVTQSLALHLDLPAPALPWHTQRDRVAEIATTLGLLVGTLGKITRDISLLMQTEVAEFLEPAAPGRGGSSTMPHKRNPVGSAIVLSAAIRIPGLVSTMLSAMLQEHERGVGGWSAEWETLTEILRLTAGSLTAIKEIAACATVDSAAMQHNLDILHGVTMAEAVSFALADKLGKEKAHQLLETLSKRALHEKISLHQALAQEPAIREFFTSDQLAKLLEPRNYLGANRAFIDRVFLHQQGDDRASD